MLAALWDALGQGYLPGKWLYHSPAQAARWLAYHQAWSPSRTEDDLLAIYQETFTTVSGLVQSDPVQVIGLGCGGGRKDVMLLETLQGAANGSPHSGLTYVPLDVSPALVGQAANLAAERVDGIKLFPVAADLEALPSLANLLPGGPQAPVRRVITCFGMLPNFSPAALIAYLAGLLRPGDLALVSANLSPGTGWPENGPTILPQYDNPPAHDWYGGALEELGLAPDHFQLTIGGEPLARDGSAWRVVVQAQLTQGSALRIGEKQMVWPSQKPLQVFFSNRFTADAAVAALSAGGLTVHKAWIFNTGEEGIYLCSAGTAG